MVCPSAYTSSTGIALSRDRLLWAGDTTFYAGICLPTKLGTSLWMMHTVGSYTSAGVVMLLVTVWLQAGTPALMNLQYDCVPVIMIMMIITTIIVITIITTTIILTYDKSGLTWNMLQMELPCGAHCFHLADVYLHYIHAARHVPNHVSDSQLCPCCNWRRAASHCSCLGFISPILVLWPQN